MIDLTTLMTYVVIVLGFVFIPGPATLLTVARATSCLLYTSPSPRDRTRSRMPSSA